MNGGQSLGNVAQTNCSSLFWMKYPRFLQNHLGKPHWTFRVTIDLKSQPSKTMKTKTWICLILSGLLLYGFSAYAGGAQCAAEAKEAAAKANASDETKAKGVADAEEAPVVKEALAVTVPTADALAVTVPIADALGVTVPTADALDVTVKAETQVEVRVDAKEDSETEVVEETK